MYLEFYGLREQPFRLTPDPRFLHLAEPHRNALIALLRGVVQRKGFQLLIGPAGTGKTTILHGFLRILTQRVAAEANLLTGLLVNPSLTREEFLESVLDELEIACSVSSKARRLAALQARLLDIRQRHGTAVLLIDEAHLLTNELLQEIWLLGNMDDAFREKILQVVLCGQPELGDLIKSPIHTALQQRVGVRSWLRALASSETRAYIAERLHIAGLQVVSPFSADSLAEIHSYSRGIPRWINLLCDGSLLRGSQTQCRQIGADLVQEVAAELGLEPVAAPPEEPFEGANIAGPARSPNGNNRVASALDVPPRTPRQGRATTMQLANGQLAPPRSAAAENCRTE